MRFLLDHCVPKPLINHLEPFQVVRAGELGWQSLSNGKLLAAAEDDGFAAIITVDKGFGQQQNLTGRQICVLLLDTRDTSLEGLLPLVKQLKAHMTKVMPGHVVRVV